MEIALLFDWKNLMDELFYMSPVFIAMGALIMYPLFPRLLKRNALSILENLLIWAVVGFIVLAVSLWSHPVVLVFLIYFIAAALTIFVRNKLGIAQIWHQTFKVCTLALIAVYGFIFILHLFVRFQLRAEFNEPRSNLASIRTCEISYFAENHTFSNNFNELGWKPAFDIGYSYYLDTNLHADTFFKAVKTEFRSSRLNIIDPRVTYYRVRTQELIPEDVLAPVLKSIADTYGIGASKEGFTAVAIGNIDSDPELDVWIVTIQYPTPVQDDRQLGDGSKVLFNVGMFVLYDDGYEIFPSSIAKFLFVVNLILWILFSQLPASRKSGQPKKADA